MSLNKHMYESKGPNFLYTEGSYNLHKSVVLSNYKKIKCDDENIKKFENIPNKEYSIKHIQSLTKLICSKRQYNFIYEAGCAHDATNPTSAFHFNNYNDLLSNIDPRDAVALGINTSFVYYNKCGVFFPFHRDQIGVGVCNVNCTGKPNIWFFIPPQNAKIFMLHIL
jgi:hypothetical protein